MISFQESLDSLAAELDQHRVYDNGYFRRLQGSKWTQETYSLHRANFFYRTEFTVKAIAQVCARAAMEDDVPTLTLFAYILNEECGNGHLKNCHSILLEKSHNLFGRVVFDMSPMPVTAAKNSPLIIEGTNRYRRRLEELGTGSYQRLLGVAMALESHAEKMLSHCRTAFRAHAERFEGSQFAREVEVYFNVHLNQGVEQRHAADARECAIRNCRTAEDLAEIAFGARETLDVQLAMWRDLDQRAVEIEGTSDRGFSDASLSLADSITHGTRAKIAELNRHRGAGSQVIDLSIGTLDVPADRRIDAGVSEFIRQNAEEIHAFAPVKGFPFLRSSLAAKIRRIHGREVDPESDILVTPGGIKGALTVMFHTFVNVGDEAVVPLPNWPHYADMLRLHRAVPRFVLPKGAPESGLNARDLEECITDKTKLLILGDCINPTGKVYTSDELRLLARVVAIHNVRRETEKKSPIRVIFDCPYEAYVMGERAVTFAAIDVDVPGYGAYALGRCTVTLTGPGKTYGMHGDRIGYVWADAETIEMAARVQVNTNSFASTYGQVATHLAVQEEMDEVVRRRAEDARANLAFVLDRLTKLGSLKIAPPDGGYFSFVDFSSHAGAYGELGHARADQFVLEEAGVAAISGSHFCQSAESMKHFVRLNCGRSIELLTEACGRIEAALSRLSDAQPTAHP